MRKKLTLYIIAILAMVTLATYLDLSVKIAAGNAKIVAGQKQLAEGEALLAQGKAKLANGKARLSTAQGMNNLLNAVPFMGLAKKLPVSGEILSVPSDKLAAGDKLVALGNQKVKNGEAQLAAGKEELQRGEARLSKTNVFRVYCGYASIFFTVLLIVLGYCWRRVWKKK
jgi:hypothetical protein